MQAREVLWCNYIQARFCTSVAPYAAQLVRSAGCALTTTGVLGGLLGPGKDGEATPIQCTIVTIESHFTRPHCSIWSLVGPVWEMSCPMDHLR